jgi:hypothetical protein
VPLMWVSFHSDPDSGAASLSQSLEVEFMQPSLIKSSDDPLVALQQLTSGLLFLSESEYSWQVYAGAADKPMPPDFTPIPGRAEEVTLDYLFSGAVSEEPDQDLISQDNSTRYRALKAWLQTHLQELRVVKHGERLKQVLITGKTTTGERVALTTQVVET